MPEVGAGVSWKRLYGQSAWYNSPVQAVRLDDYSLSASALLEPPVCYESPAGSRDNTTGGDTCGRELRRRTHHVLTEMDLLSLSRGVDIGGGTVSAGDIVVVHPGTYELPLTLDLPIGCWIVGIGRRDETVIRSSGTVVGLSHAGRTGLRNLTIECTGGGSAVICSQGTLALVHCDLRSTGRGVTVLASVEDVPAPDVVIPPVGNPDLDIPDTVIAVAGEVSGQIELEGTAGAENGSGEHGDAEERTSTSASIDVEVGEEAGEDSNSLPHIRMLPAGAEPEASDSGSDSESGSGGGQRASQVGENSVEEEALPADVPPEAGQGDVESDAGNQEGDWWDGAGGWEEVVTPGVTCPLAWEAKPDEAKTSANHAGRPAALVVLSECNVSSALAGFTGVGFLRACEIRAERVGGDSLQAKPILPCFASSPRAVKDRSSGPSAWLGLLLTDKMRGCLFRQCEAALCLGDGSKVENCRVLALSAKLGVQGLQGCRFWVCDSAVEGGIAGVYLRADAQALVERCRISQSQMGVSARDDARLDLRESQVTGNSICGMVLCGASRGRVKDCRLEQNRQDAVAVFDQAHISLEGCRLADNMRGLEVGGDSRALVHGCTIESNMQNGIAAMGNVSAALVVRNSQVSRNLATGLLVGGTCRCRVQGCSLLANLKDGVGVAASARVALDRCKVSGNARGGVIANDASALRMRSSRVWGNEENGVVGTRTAELDLEGCQIQENGRVGVLLANASHAKVAACAVENNGQDGIAAAGDSRLELSSSRVAGNAHAGLLCGGACEANCRDCRILDNAQDGIGAATAARLILSGATLSGNGRAGLIVNDSSVTDASACFLRGNGENGAVATRNASLSLHLCEVADNAKVGLLLADSVTVSVRASVVTNNRSNGVVAAGDAEVRFEGCSLENNVQAGLLLGGNTHVEVRRTVVSDNGQDGCGVASTANMQLYGCKVTRNRHAGVILNDSSRVVMDQSEVDGNAENGVVVTRRAELEQKECRIRDNGRVGLLMADGGAAMLRGCSIEGNHSHGMVVAGTSSAALVRTVFVGNQAAGLLVGGSSQVSVRDGMLERNGQDGVGVAGKGRIVLCDTVLRDNVRNGLLLSDASAVRLERCSLAGNGENAVLAAATADVVYKDCSGCPEKPAERGSASSEQFCVDGGAIAAAGGEECGGSGLSGSEVGGDNGPERCASTDTESVEALRAEMERRVGVEARIRARLDDIARLIQLKQAALALARLQVGVANSALSLATAGQSHAQQQAVVEIAEEEETESPPTQVDADPTGEEGGGVEL